MQPRLFLTMTKDMAYSVQEFDMDIAKETCSLIEKLLKVSAEALHYVLANSNQDSEDWKRACYICVPDQKCLNRSLIPWMLINTCIMSNTA